jgi:hypothetical protein
MSAFISPNIRTIFDREPTDIFDVCTRVWGIGIPNKRLTRRYAVAIKWRYGNTWVDLALIYEPSYIYKRWRRKIQGVREKNFRKIKITQKLDS